jgi:hypothetical protein
MGKFIFGECIMYVMKEWQSHLRYDSVTFLLSSQNKAINYFTKRDLLGEPVQRIESLWNLPEVEKMVKRQGEDGSWEYHGGNPHIRSHRNYDQLETYRMVGELVEKYRLRRTHPSIGKAAEFLFRFQKSEGDFRGIYGNQYTPNYSAGIMELLIKAGYQNDARIKKGFAWLLSTRQNDGGWAIPARTHRMPLNVKTMHSETIESDISMPSSHLVTGIVLRAFAAHEKYRKRREALQAGEFLATRICRRDAYPDRGTAQYWERVSFPFWFTDIVSSLDTLSRMGFSADDTRIANALRFLRGKQKRNGLFELKLLKGKDRDLPLWVALAICRIYARFFG